jgi:transposase
MLRAGLDLSRRRLDVCLVGDAGELVAQIAAPPDVDGLARLAARLSGERVRAVIESMTGARFVHDTLQEHGWEVLVADAQKVKGLAPLACTTDKIDARVLAELSWRDLVPAIWLPDPSIRRERELARYRVHLVRHRTTLKNRIHATLMTFGHPCPVSDLFGHAGRELLDRLAIPDPWRRNVDAGLELIDDLELQIASLTVELRRQAPITATSRCWSPRPGSAGSTPSPSRQRIGDIARFASPAKLVGYTGLCPRVYQSGATDRRGPISKQGSRYLRLALFEAALHGLQPPRLCRALPSDEETPRPPTRPQGRPDRSVAQADRGDLAHAHPQPALRPGRRPFSSSRLTAPFGNAPPERTSHSARSPTRPSGDRDLSAARHPHTARGPQPPAPKPHLDPTPSFIETNRGSPELARRRSRFQATWCSSSPTLGIGSS